MVLYRYPKTPHLHNSFITTSQQTPFPKFHHTRRPLQQCLLEFLHSTSPPQKKNNGFLPINFNQNPSQVIFCKKKLLKKTIDLPSRELTCPDCPTFGKGSNHPLKSQQCFFFLEGICLFKVFREFFGAISVKKITMGWPLVEACRGTGMPRWCNWTVRILGSSLRLRFRVVGVEKFPANESGRWLVGF